jgi:mannose-6-phosphate isomerase
MYKPIRLAPSLREKVWGRTRLEPWFADSREPIGEAWYGADLELPLLVKFIFTAERLSVQVHPDDGEDGPLGKTEMWHILAADPGSSIALGFREPLTRARLREAALSGEIEYLVNWVPVHAGETYFTPAHTVHAIGAGIVLCEIQQNSDVTYRLWDYGRLRPLHVEKAVPISDLTVHPGASQPVSLGKGHDTLVWSKHFVTEMVRLDAGDEFTPSAERCQLWICIAGAGAIGGEPVRAGEVVLLEESGDQPAIRGDGASFLRTYVPA